MFIGGHPWFCILLMLYSVSIIAVLKIHLKHPLKLHRRSLSWVKWFFASWAGGWA